MAKGCCEYRPTLPKWITLIQVFKFSLSTGTHSRQLPDILGQIIAQDQGAHEGDRANAYMRHRKEDDRLRDPWDYGTAPNGPADVVSFLLPSNRRVYYMVKEVQAMALDHPNEHMVTTLVKLTAAEAATVTGGGSSAEPAEPSVPPTTAAVSPASVLNDGIEESTVTLALKYADGSPVIGKDVTASVTGSAVLSDVAGVTDVFGQWVITVTNLVLETVTVLFDWIDDDIASPPIEFSDAPAEGGDCDDLVIAPVLRVTFANVGTNECGDCDEFNDSFDLAAVGTSPYSLWVLSGAEHSCYPGGVNYSLTIVDGLIEVLVSCPDTDQLVIFQASCTEYAASPFLSMNTGQSQFFDLNCKWYTGVEGETATCQVSIP